MKTNTICVRRIVGPFLSTLLFLCCCATAVAAHMPVATIIAEHGQVLVERSSTGQFQTASTRESLYFGDVITTSGDGGADVLFSDGSQLKLDSNTSVRVTLSANSGGSQNVFQALIGVFWAHIHPGDVIETPSANLVVRGTEVLVSILSNGTVTLTVLSGHVFCYNKYGSVLLSTNEQTTIKPGQAPTGPILVDPSSLTSWTDDVVWQPTQTTAFSFSGSSLDTLFSVLPVGLFSYFHTQNPPPGGTFSGPNGLSPAPEISITIGWLVIGILLALLVIVRRRKKSRSG